MRIHTYVKKQMPETAEEKRNAEQLLLCATIIESSKDIILSVDTDGIITSWNKGAEKIFGYASCEIIGMHISVLIPQYLRLQESEIMERILTGKKKLSHYETERIKKDGRFITVSLTISPIMDTGGKIIGASKISTDITERKRLQKKQALFASLVDSCDDAIISKDLNDMITSWNFGAEKAFGYKAGEVIGRHISILLPPRLQNDEMEIMGRVSKGETISHYETERIDKKGGTIYVSLTISPIRDELGTIIGTSKISRDISKRKKAEENLKRSESNIAAIMENTDAFIYSIDTDFRYTTFNPQLQKSMLDIYGLAIKLGDNVFGFLLEAAPDEAESWRHVYLEAFKGRSIHFVKEFQVGSFQSFMRFSVNPIWEEGEIIGLSCIAIDITQEKQSEAEIKSLNESLERKVRERTAELQNVNAELEAFSYTVSHDLQAPLRALSGFAKILLGDYTGHMNEQGLECLNFIDASANKMSELIKALLHFSQMGKGPLQKQQTNMNELVAVTIHEIKQEIKNDSTVLTVFPLPPCACDSGLMKQVWTNLISNAVKYSSKVAEPIIEIGTRDIDGSAAYYIKDNGAGFDMKHAEKLFGIFQRLHDQSEYEGTGVGLAIVHRIIERHGGRVWAEGKIGEGATFYFTLPKM